MFTVLLQEGIPRDEPRLLPRLYQGDQRITSDPSNAHLLDRLRVRGDAPGSFNGHGVQPGASAERNLRVQTPRRSREFHGNGGEVFGPELSRSQEHPLYISDIFRYL